MEAGEWGFETVVASLLSEQWLICFANAMLNYVIYQTPNQTYI